MAHRGFPAGLGLTAVAGALALACAGAPVAPTPVEHPEERRLATADGWLLGSALGIGRAPPVVLVHGIGGNHHLFDPQLAYLRTARRVVAFDQRGCGGSADAPGGNYDLDTRVRDVGLVLDALRLEQVVLVGHGTGAQVVARYAERNPARVLGLVLVNPVSGNAEAGRIAQLPDPGLRSAVDGWLESLLDQAAPATRQAVHASVTIARIPAMREMLLDASRTDILGSLGVYPGPVRVLATPGEAVPGPLRPDVEVRRVAGGSHWSTLDSPDEVNRALGEFLRPLDTAAAQRRGSG